MMQVGLFAYFTSGWFADTGRRMSCVPVRFRQTVLDAAGGDLEAAGLSDRASEFAGVDPLPAESGSVARAHGLHAPNAVFGLRAAQLKNA